jgi:hypothetical protein
MLRVGTWSLDQTKERMDKGATSSVDLVSHMMETRDEAGSLFRLKDLWLEIFLMLGVGEY